MQIEGSGLIVFTPPLVALEFCTQEHEILAEKCKPQLGFLLFYINNIIYMWFIHIKNICGISRSNRKLQCLTFYL